MYTQAQIREIAQRIKDGLPECEVILIGSYAWGRPKPSSDIDLAIITPDDTTPEGLADYKLRALHLSKRGAIPMDVLAYRRCRLDELGEGTLAYKIKTEGVPL